MKGLFLLIKPPLKWLYIHLRKLYMVLWAMVNRLGTQKSCNICGQKFITFTSYLGGSKNISQWEKEFKFVGSDVDNYGCMYCGSFDRERHLFMYFDKLDIWSVIKNARILHFAPEPNLSKRIDAIGPTRYVKGDLFPSKPTIQKVDLTNIAFDNDSFDVLICNHVLEHVPEFKKGLKEIYRVLNPNGIAILQTPFSRLLHHTFEDPGINTDALRHLYYGQADHVRYFSEADLLQSFRDAGFELQLVKHRDVFESGTAKYFGVNEDEDLIRVVKPAG